MRVLMLTSTYLPRIGGIEYHIDGLSNALTATGVKTDVAVIGDMFKTEKHVSDGVKQVYYLPANMKNAFRVFGDLRRSIDINTYDILHVHDPRLGTVSWNICFARKYGKPAVLSTHGGIFHTRDALPIKKIYWNYVAKTAIRIYDQAICCSSNDYDLFKGIACEERLRVIENGVDTSRFCPASVFNDFGTNNFIYYGRFSKNKNLDKLVDIFTTLIGKKDSRISSTEDLILTLIGQSHVPKEAEAIKKKAADYGGRIKILPFLTDEKLLEEIRKASYFITTSLYEGFGISIIEAMAAGRIVIANNIAPINTFIKDGENGFLINCNESNEAIAEKLRQIMGLDKKKKSGIIAAAVSFANRFSWEIKVKEYMECYKDVLRQSRGR